MLADDGEEKPEAEQPDAAKTKGDDAKAETAAAADAEGEGES